MDDSTAVKFQNPQRTAFVDPSSTGRAALAYLSIMGPADLVRTKTFLAAFFGRYTLSICNGLVDVSKRCGVVDKMGSPVQ